MTTYSIELNQSKINNSNHFFFYFYYYFFLFINFFFEEKVTKQTKPRKLTKLQNYKLALLNTYFYF